MSLARAKNAPRFTMVPDAPTNPNLMNRTDIYPLTDDNRHSWPRYCSTTFDDSLDCPALRTRKVYGTSFNFDGTSLATISSRILNPLASRLFSTRPKSARRNMKNPDMGSRSFTPRNMPANLVAIQDCSLRP